MIETILIATDGSAAASSAEQYGIELAARLRARVLALSVLEDRVLRSVRELVESGSGGPGLEARLRARAEAACRRLAERARARGIDSSSEVTGGIADDRIVERGGKADLIVIGRDGEHADCRTGLIGSCADGVLRKASRPAIVVPRAAPTTGPVLLAFDGSPGSKIALRVALELATRLGEGLHIFVDSKDKERSLARFEEARRLLGSPGIRVHEASSTLGRPDAKIVDAARDAEAALIVMGAFGRSRMHEFFLGSNSAAVVRTSPIAVLLAR